MYGAGMGERRKPGSPKGQLKPRKRVLDAKFPSRLRTAMQLRPGLDNAQLAREAGCSRALIGQYLNAKDEKKAPDALVIFAIADALKVSARWLLTGAGDIQSIEAVTPDQSRALSTYNQLNELSEALRDYWISQGEELIRRQPPIAPTVARPFKDAPQRSKVKERAG